MKRELKLALTQKLGETTNPKTVQTLNERYQKVYQLLAPAYPQLRLIDTTNLDEKTMVETIADNILKSLFAKISNSP